MTQCRTEKEIQERLEKYKFYTNFAVHVYDYINNLEHGKETGPGGSEYVQQKRSEFLSVVDEFIFDAPGNILSYVQIHKARSNRTPDWVVDFDNVKPSEQSIAVFLLFINILPRWDTMHIIEKRPELLNVTISYLDPPLRIAIVNNMQNLTAALIKKGADIFQTVLVLPRAQRQLTPSEYENVLVRPGILHVLALQINRRSRNEFISLLHTERCQHK